MFEIFSSWEWWQIALTAVFDSVWLVFIVLDIRRRIALKKRRKLKYLELKEQGLSDDQINEIF